VITLRLFGPGDLRAADSRELAAVLAQPKRLALLAHLAIARPRNAQARDTLLSLFWPTLDESHARSALRTAIHMLRRALGGEVLSTRADGALRVDDTALWCDAVEFDRAIENGDYLRAVQLHAESFLTGFHLSGADEFGRWLDEQRSRFAFLASRAADALADREERQGNFAMALQWARYVHALSPYSETAMRRVVTLLHGLGDRIGAIRECERFTRRVAAEYDVQPAAETLALMSRLRSSEMTDRSRPNHARMAL